MSRDLLQISSCRSARTVTVNFLSFLKSHRRSLLIITFRLRRGRTKILVYMQYNGRTYTREEAMFFCVCLKRESTYFS